MNNRWLWLLLVLLPLGCKTRPESAPIARPSVEKIAQELPVAGPWSQPQNGVRCRILLDRKSPEETSALLASFEIENVATQPIALTGSGAPPFGPASIAWKAGQQPMLVDVKATHGEPATSTLTIAPGETYATEPVKLLVPSGAGPRNISASLTTTPIALSAPPVTTQIVPTAWGKPSNGLRLRLGSARLTYPAGQAPAIQLYIHNTTDQPLAIDPPDWSTLIIDTRNDLVLLKVSGDKELSTKALPGAVWTQPVAAPLLLAPGTYRLRLTLDCPERPASAPAAWNGTATTNDLVLEVRAQ